MHIGKMSRTCTNGLDGLSRKSRRAALALGACGMRNTVAKENEEEDELEKFLNITPHTIHCSPLEWWTREEQRIEYPRLHHMAIDILSIPPLSDDIERAFSGVRRTTTWTRGALHMDTVEIQECLCNWIANELIHDNPEVLEKAMAVAEAATAVAMTGDDEVRIQHHAKAHIINICMHMNIERWLIIHSNMP